jgi:hypothetical protein
MGACILTTSFLRAPLAIETFLTPSRLHWPRIFPWIQGRFQNRVSPIEKIMSGIGAPTVEGVAEGAEGGFVVASDVLAGAERTAGGAFEAAEEAFDLPRLP